ncbi:uncharacterized protein LOC131432978 [Malaya genurostris]|uniref:uncharacterized protein LOC131432978 n=1 Tax=Malaya genurostris TaxID=325434 RepID=UPI0026F3A4E1|nr:uncharacterized protein LOC131432978 [Malaya genurostris]
MNFSELDHLSEVLLTEVGADLEPIFVRQSEVVERNDAVVRQNIDWVTALQNHLERVRCDQFAVDQHDRLLEQLLGELEQSISALERYPQSVTPFCVVGTNGEKEFHRSTDIRFPLAGVCGERSKYYQTLLGLPCWIDSLERDLHPQADQLRKEIDDHRSNCEKVCPVLELMTYHTRILLAVEKHMNEIDDLLTANRERFRDFGLGGEKSMCAFFAALYGKK